MFSPTAREAAGDEAGFLVAKDHRAEALAWLDAAGWTEATGPERVPTLAPETAGVGPPAG